MVFLIDWLIGCLPSVPQLLLASGGRFVVGFSSALPAIAAAAAATCCRSWPTPPIPSHSMYTAPILSISSRRSRGRRSASATESPWVSNSERVQLPELARRNARLHPESQQRQCQQHDPPRLAAVCILHDDLHGEVWASSLTPFSMCCSHQWDTRQGTALLRSGFSLTFLCISLTSPWPSKPCPPPAAFVAHGWWH